MLHKIKHNNKWLKNTLEFMVEKIYTWGLLLKKNLYFGIYGWKKFIIWDLLLICQVLISTW